MMSRKNFLLSLTILFFFRPIFSLDLTGLSDSLSGIFGDSYIDTNEGTTIFRSLNIPTGGRPESMGTAYTGLADDISFFDYNPAGSAVLDRTEAAVFHNAWIADSAMETIAGTIRNGNLGLGAQLKCFYVPFTEYNLYGERVAGSYYSETSFTANVAYNFLAGYDFKGIAVGANLRGSWRSIPDYTDNTTDEIISGSGLAQSALALMTDIGILFRLNGAKLYNDREPNIRIGMSLNNIGVALTGFGSSVKIDDPLPTRIAVGVSYKPFSILLISTEFRQPVNLQSLSTSGKWSAAIGTEIKITTFFTFNTGFLLQGANPRISLGSGFLIRGIQMNVNYTFDLTSSINPVNHISLSAKLRLSDRGRAEKQRHIDTLYTLGLARYSAGDFESAMEIWKEILQIDSRFDPAIEGIKAIERSESLYQHIKNIQSLD
ncbi:MAG: UPF0164 family protein [Treponema sp.]|nr:UPF0164 family protein [Treponema sp.]